MKLTNYSVSELIDMKIGLENELISASACGNDRLAEVRQDQIDEIDEELVNRR